jgi:hypothetical protein
VKKRLLAVPLLAAGVLATGCASLSTASGASAPASATADAGSASTPASTSTGAGSPGTPTTTASPSSTTPGTGTASTAACDSGDLKASLGGGAGAGMSQDHTGLQLRNVGSSPCALYGYPGVSWVAGADGHQVGAAAERQADAGGGSEGTVILAPGATASSPLDIVDAAVIPQSACKPVPVRGLRVYPPGQKAALFIPLATNSGGYGECSASTQQPTLIVGYVQQGVQPGGGSVG